MNTLIMDELDIDAIPHQSKSCFKLNLIKNALGDYWQVPVMIAKGKPGKVFGITAAIHGNELNGIPTIHSIWEHIQPASLTGVIILVPVVNVGGFITGTREFLDGKDLNRIMPGKKTGSSSARYVYQFVEKLAKHFDYHLDLHTASEGRINSFYIKADLSNKFVKKMSDQLSPKIILDQPAPKGTFRSIFEKRDLPSLTLELGDPNLFQYQHIKPAYQGILKVLSLLGFIQSKLNTKTVSQAVCVERSEWFYAKHGGILTVYPSLAERVNQGDTIASISDIFGQKVIDIQAKFDGIVIGKSTYPVCEEGARVIHLGKLT